MGISVYPELSCANLLSCQVIQKLWRGVFSMTTTLSGIGGVGDLTQTAYLPYEKERIKEAVLSWVRKTKTKKKNLCVLLQPQAHLHCMNVYMCVYERGFSCCLLMWRCLVSVCVCVCLLSQHLNDIKALCKLSPWQLFRIPSPLSV